MAEVKGGQMPYCNDTMDCFAKVKYIWGRGTHYKCSILTATYPNGECPFRKEIMELSDKDAKSKRKEAEKIERARRNYAAWLKMHKR